MRNPIVFSVAFHLLIFGSMWFTIPSIFNKNEIQETPIIIDIVNLDDKITSMPEEKKDQKSSKKSKNIKKEIISKSKPSTKPRLNQENRDSSNVVEIYDKTKSKQPKKKKPNLVPIDTTKLKPKTKPKPPSKGSSFDTGRIALLIDKSKKTSNQESVKEKENENNFLIKPKIEKDFLRKVEKKNNLIKNAKVSSRLTMRDIDLIRYQIERNWTPPSGARDAQDLIIKIKIGLNLDGSLRGAPVIVDTGRTNSGFFRAAADSAIRAVYKAQPFKGLPKAKYDAWRDITLTFNPKQLLGG